LKQLSKKLDFKRYKLFRVKKKITTSNYKLNLPTSIKVWTKVFHISLLKPTLKRVSLKEKINIDTNKDKYNVKEVIDL